MVKESGGVWSVNFVFVDCLESLKRCFFVATVRFCTEIVTDDVVPAFANVTLVSKDKCRRGTLHRTLCFLFQKMKINFSVMTKGCCCLRSCKNSPQLLPVALETV